MNAFRFWLNYVILHNISTINIIFAREDDGVLDSHVGI
jgi:hypothetical protein